jgi:hypothetical protein
MTKEQILEKFKQFCDKTPADQFKVLRFPEHIIDVKREKINIRLIFYYPYCKIIYSNLESNAPIEYPITANEFLELKNHWMEKAQVKFAICGYRNKEQPIDLALSHQDELERIYFVSSKGYGEYVFTRDPLQAKKFSSLGEVEIQMAQIIHRDHVEKKLKIIEIGIGTN